MTSLKATTGSMLQTLKSSKPDTTVGVTTYKINEPQTTTNSVVFTTAHKMSTSQTTTNSVVFTTAHKMSTSQTTTNLATTETTSHIVSTESKQVDDVATTIQSRFTTEHITAKVSMKYSTISNDQEVSMKDSTISNRRTTIETTFIDTITEDKSLEHHMTTTNHVISDGMATADGFKPRTTKRVTGKVSYLFQRGFKLFNKVVKYSVVEYINLLHTYISM